MTNTTKKTKTTSVKKKVKIEPMTVAQFRSKLEGIEMFQEEEWHPSKEQWATIRLMIDNIIDNPVKKETVVQNQSYVEDMPYDPWAGNRGNNVQQNFAQVPSGISSLANSNQDNSLLVPTVPDSSEIVPSGKPTINASKFVPKVGPGGKVSSSFE